MKNIEKQTDILVTIKNYINCSKRRQKSGFSSKNNDTIKIYSTELIFVTSTEKLLVWKY